MTAAEKALVLYDKLAAERARLRGTLPIARWLEVVAEFLTANKVAKKKGTPLNKMTDAEFLAHVHAQEIYRGLDIQREIGKCVAYFPGKVVSRSRILNWLNNAQKPFRAVAAAGAEGDEINIYVEPGAEWRDVAASMWRDLTVGDQTWDNIKNQYGRRIIIEMRRRAAK